MNDVALETFQKAIHATHGAEAHRDGSTRRNPTGGVAKLNRKERCRGGGLLFDWSASGAIGRVLRQVRKDLETLDKRTNPSQDLAEAVKRPELLQKEISRQAAPHEVGHYRAL